jgi:uncharacterized protein YgbK (DUF1537 family)
MATRALRIAYYGDDFTGATDTLATATQGGLRTLLFLRVPTPELLAAAGDLDCLGIAGASRSMAPSAMEHELLPVAAFLAELDTPVVHYKTCSTFDSAPDVGNIAVAVRVLSAALPGRFLPIVGGQPNIGRYCVFGHLFAAAEAGGTVLRIDRHPMARHPVTPMTESDLRLHLERQGLKNIKSAAYPVYDAPPDVLDRAVEHAAEEGDALLFDVTRPGDLAAVGRAIWQQARRRGLVAVGPSGVTQALCAHWHDTGEVRVPEGSPSVRAAEGPVFVMAGSLSPVTRRQVEAASDFARIEIDPVRLGRGDADYVSTGVQRVADILNSGRSVIAHTVPFGERPADQSLPGLSLAQETGKFVARLLSRVRLRRLGVAGGDTSSWTLRALDVWGLSFVGHLAPGVALCRAHSTSKDLDGIEMMLKGGQMGQVDLFQRLQDGG